MTIIAIHGYSPLAAAADKPKCYAYVYMKVLKLILKLFLPKL